MDSSQMQLFDVYDIWYSPWWKSTAFQVVFYFSICLISCFLVYYIFKLGWFKKRLSFEQQTIKNLQNLSAQSYQDSQQICNAYFQLTLILKKYLEHRYAVSLLDKTDIELLAALKSMLSDEQYFLIEEFLQRVSAIKFSSQGAVAVMLQDDIRFIEQFVMQSFSNFDKVGTF